MAGVTPKLCFEVLTLFPELFGAARVEGLIGKAIRDGTLGLEINNFREFATGRHRSVDDLPFGGGAGMLISPEPVVACLESVQRLRGPMHRVLVTPSAPRFNQAAARRLAQYPRIGLICGRYEGIDDRVRDHYVDECFSLGDFVLNGGEVAALAIIEAVGRLVTGVVGNADSLVGESFSNPMLLEHPQYTRPPKFREHAVPDILRGGDHSAIARWRRWSAILRTWMIRPDLALALALAHAQMAHGASPRLVIALPEAKGAQLDSETWGQLEALFPSPGSALRIRTRVTSSGRLSSDLRELRRRVRKSTGLPTRILAIDCESGDDSSSAEHSASAHCQMAAAIDFLASEATLTAREGDPGRGRPLSGSDGGACVVLLPVTRAFDPPKDCSGLGTVAAEPDLWVQKIPPRPSKALALRGAIEHPSQPTGTWSPAQLALSALDLLDGWSSLFASQAGSAPADSKDST